MTPDDGPEPGGNPVYQSLASDPGVLETVLETAGVGVVVFGPDSTVEYVDERVERFLGLSREVVGSKRNDFLRSVVAERLSCPDGTPAPGVDDDGASGSGSDPAFRVSGDADRPERWVRHDSVPLERGPLAGGRLDVFVETTAAKTRERLERYEAVVENVDDTVLVVDGEWSIEYANDDASQGQVFTSSALEGSPVLDVVGDVLADGEDLGDFENGLAAAIDDENGGSGAVELQLAPPSGRGTYRFEFSPFSTDDGRKVAVTVRDIDEKKRYERDLEESRNRYRTLVENFPSGTVVLVDEELRNPTVRGTPLEGAGVTDDETEGNDLADALPPEMSDVLVSRYADALDGKASSFRETIGDRHFRFRVVPVRDDDDETFAVMGLCEDVTERECRERALEKRRRVLRELHRATRESNLPTTVGEIPGYVIELLEAALDFEYFSVKRFDEEDGVLRPATRSSSVAGDPALGTVPPGDDPIWQVYRTGQSRTLDGEFYPEAVDGIDVNQALAVPIGEFGVVVALTTGPDEFDQVDVDFAEVVATNAESVFERLHSDRMRSEVTSELTEQRERVEELSSIVDTVHVVRRRLASAETREALESEVCETLLRTKHVDFAWVGRPRGDDTDIVPQEWAGDGNGYLESIDLGTTDGATPTQRAARDCSLCSVSDISARVLEKTWAKEALSWEFRSVLSVPLAYDDVLYGVLTVYSRTEDAFGRTFEHLFQDIGSLLMNYIRVLERRYGGSDETDTELEFELADPTYPLHKLGTETGARIRYDTTIEETDDEVRCLVTVEEDCVEAVLDRAEGVNTVVEAEQFGPEDTNRVSLIVKKPFLASEVGKHGGRLAESISDGTKTKFRVTLPGEVSKRPLLDSLSSRYGAMELIAQRQTNTSQTADATSGVDRLTERQYEILNAAYHGGYYETPRKVTGEALAESFGISSPAVYSHLQAAQRKLLAGVFETDQRLTAETAGGDE